MHGQFDEYARGKDPKEFDLAGPMLWAPTRFAELVKIVEDADKYYFGDWYDVGAVAGAVNFALADAGHPERFVHLHPEDLCPVTVFADPAAFLPIAARYFVPVDDGTAAAMTAGGAYERSVTGRG
jgi:hypothetical protein